MKSSIEHLNRIRKARHLLGKKRKLFHIEAYQCSVENCGHSDSIILAHWQYGNQEFVPVCYSLEKLEESVTNLQDLSDDLVLEKLLHKKLK